MPRISASRSWVLAIVAGGAILAVLLAWIISSGPGTAARGLVLPATPRQWVDEWTAAAVDDPARVCHELYAPALARAFQADMHRACLAYYTNTESTSFRIRHVLVDGNAAAVEARVTGQRPNWGYFTMLLSRTDGGWQAVDIVPGGPVRPR